LVDQPVTGTITEVSKRNSRLCAPQRTNQSPVYSMTSKLEACSKILSCCGARNLAECLFRKGATDEITMVERLWVGWRAAAPKAAPPTAKATNGRGRRLMTRRQLMIFTLPYCICSGLITK